jgi:hypothetical protein
MHYDSYLVVAAGRAPRPDPAVVPAGRRPLRASTVYDLPSTECQRNFGWRLAADRLHRESRHDVGSHDNVSGCRARTRQPDRRAHRLQRRLRPAHRYRGWRLFCEIPSVIVVFGANWREVPQHRRTGALLDRDAILSARHPGAGDGWNTGGTPSRRRTHHGRPPRCRRC